MKTFDVVLRKLSMLHDFNRQLRGYVLPAERDATKTKVLEGTAVSTPRRAVSAPKERRG